MSDARQNAPATERNREPILDVLRRVLPPDGTILEISSGTGQHAVFFAPALAPRLWQPSEPDAGSRESIAAWSAAFPAANLLAPLALDVLDEPWPEIPGSLAAIVNINMIHIAPWAACGALMRGAGARLPAGGVLFLYGPYREKGAWRSPNDPAFDDWLKARDTSFGVRDLEAVVAEAARAGLDLVHRIDMPAGNLSVVFRKRGVAD